jgi:non-canonical purine NTP pyrophosphatase (RdgB/HAM1 family)
MSDDKKIWYVTTSKLKFHEAFTFCKSKNMGSELVQNETELFEVQTKEPKDVRAVALHKGKQAWDRLGSPVIVEYTGLFLSKYGNFPGSLTKHVFKGIGYRGLFRLVDSGDTAVFVSLLTYVDQYGNANVFEGRQEGFIVKPEKLEINSEFPFDQIFVPQGFDLSYEDLKKDVSPTFEQTLYRLSALSKLVQHLKKSSLQ